MVKIIQLTSNDKQQDDMSVAFITKNDKEIVATVENKYRCEILKTDNIDYWNNNTNVKVFCSCSDFQFRWAYTLYKHGALLYAENFVLTPPKIKNPGNKVGACKHINATIRKLLNNNK